ncbi:MAG: hypothetical protein ACKN9U_17480 [Pirellulaceae bacterium]
MRPSVFLGRLSWSANPPSLVDAVYFLLLDSLLPGQAKELRPAHTPYKQLLVATIARWWTVLVDASSW